MYSGGGYNGPPPGGYPGGYPGAGAGYQNPSNYYPGGQPNLQSGGIGGMSSGNFGGQPTGYQGQSGGYSIPNAGQVNPQIAQWFSTVDKDNSGKINGKELQAALVNGQGKNFSDTACNLMIGMFDNDKSGTIDLDEFQKLFNYVNQWLTVFKTYDRDQSGLIEEPELSQAFQQMGFQFSEQFTNYLIAKSDIQNHKQISVDQFIVLCVQIQRFTEAFRSRDSEQKGVITIGFEDFLGVALNTSL